MKMPGRGRKEPQFDADDGFEDDDFDDMSFERIGRPEKTGPSKFKRFVLIFLLLGIIGGGAWWYFIGSNQMADESTLPVIRAEVGPIKVKPENPGGMEIPNRDKLVYERLGNNPGEPLIERLLPEPEKPVTMPEPEPAPVVVEAKPVVKEAVPVPPVKVEEIVEPKPAPMKLEPAPVEIPKAPEPKVVVSKPAPTKPMETVTPTGKYKIQLASVRSEAAAEGEWKRLSKKQPELLGKLTMSIMKADLGDKGLFYRLRGGPLPDEATAKKLCADLTAKKIGCLVVRP